jgi:hypothetical protein
MLAQQARPSDAAPRAAPTAAKQSLLLGGTHCSGIRAFESWDHLQALAGWAPAAVPTQGGAPAAG